VRRGLAARHTILHDDPSPLALDDFGISEKGNAALNDASVPHRFFRNFHLHHCQGFENPSIEVRCDPEGERLARMLLCCWPCEQLENTPDSPTNSRKVSGVL
jgi:hypothetical protein